MMELKGEEAGLKCQLSGLGIVSLVFQVYLLLSGSSNISNSKNQFFYFPLFVADYYPSQGSQMLMAAYKPDTLFQGS